MDIKSAVEKFRAEELKTHDIFAQVEEGTYHGKVAIKVHTRSVNRFGNHLFWYMGFPVHYVYSPTLFNKYGP